jgi:hypothetical protein
MPEMFGAGLGGAAAEHAAKRCADVQGPRH